MDKEGGLELEGRNQLPEDASFVPLVKYQEVIEGLGESVTEEEYREAMREELGELKGFFKIPGDNPDDLQIKIERARDSYQREHGFGSTVEINVIKDGIWINGQVYDQKEALEVAFSPNNAHPDNLVVGIFARFE